MTADAHTGLLLRAYLMAAVVLGPVVRWHIRKRIGRGKEDAQRYREKFGEATAERPQGTLVWLHAVGVGEVLTLPALIRAMATKRPELNFLVTSSTLTAARAVAANLPDKTDHQYLPVDCLPFVHRFLDHWRPDLSVWAEQDIWPALVVESSRRSVPLAMVNGRMGQDSFASKWRVRSLFADLYTRFSVIEVQDEKSRSHMQQLGIPAGSVLVRRSLKAGALPLWVDQNRLRQLSEQLSNRFIWLAASTHAVEEAKVFAAHRTVLETKPDGILILCPRDPKQGGSAYDTARSIGLSPQLQSLNPDIASNTNLFIADSIGELGLWYTLADQAFVGGSLEPVGGHNPYEPMRMNCAVIHGPHIANFAQDYATAHVAGAALQVSGTAELAASVLNPATLKTRVMARGLLAAGEENLNDCAETLLRLVARDG